MTRTPAGSDNPSVKQLAVLLALVAGCHRGAKDAGPPCGTVAAKFLAIAKADLEAAKVDEPTLRAVESQLPAMRDSLAQRCSDAKWDAAVRQCMVAALDHAAFTACEQQLTDDQRRDLSRAASGSTDDKSSGAADH